MNDSKFKDHKRECIDNNPKSNIVDEQSLGNSDDPINISKHKGWYSRGYLPHRDEPEVFQSITYRLVDSIPAVIHEKIEVELLHASKDRKEAERRIRLQARLDAGYGSCILRDPIAAECVESNWKHFDGDRYDLVSWAIMPNHVHVLIKLYEDVTLGKVIQSWKGYTGRKIKKMLHDGLIELDPKDGGSWIQGKGDDNIINGLCRAGAWRSQGPDRTLVDQTFPQGIWMREYWDRMIRDEDHFLASVEYIESNPVKGKLVKSPEHWPWSSASDKGKRRGVNYFNDSD